MSELTMTAGTALADGTAPALLEWGLQVIRAFQGSRPALLTFLARAVTEIGNPLTYIFLTAFTYWCVDERRAFRAGVVLFVSNGLNIALKNGIHEPRPYAFDPSINLVWEPSFSFPSGHSQNAAAFWPVLIGVKPRFNEGLLRAEKPKNGRNAGAVLFLCIPFLIGLSRVYLGVHYPTDVLGGWAIGAVIAAVGLLAVPRFLVFLGETDMPTIRALRESYRQRVAAVPRSAATARLALAALGAAALNALGGDDTSMGGALFGFAAGPALVPSLFRAAEGGTAKKGARLAAGLVGLGFLYFGLKVLLPGEGEPLYRLARFARYALCGFWTSGLAPWLFVRTGLSRSGQ